MKKVTMDTGVLINILDAKPGAQDVQELLRWHKEGKIEIYVSNRVFEHDTRKMLQAQVQELQTLLKEYNISIEGAPFRLNFSLLSSRDLLSGGPSIRTPEEMKKFINLVGKDPSGQFASSKTLSNKLGDYDSLKDHFASGRDVFLTLDKKHYLDVHKRKRYEEQLGLVILSPTEFLEKNANLQQA